MLSLLKSERFQNEVKDYKQQIEKITSADIKTKAENQLNKLIAQVKHLDSHHEELIFNKQIREMSGDNRNKILEIRRSLDRIIKDYYAANNIKLKQNL